ncbi:DNA-binding response regulator [bacterium]|nr:DNA-binding response regulator [bacterium]
MKILIVEDEEKIAHFVQAGLKSEGYSVDWANNGEDGFFMLSESEYDMMILDLKLPKIDGMTLCNMARKSGKKIPIVMLTARDSVEDRVNGLDAGADDYITKPFSFEELLARIRALSRRYNIGSGSSKGLTIGPLEIATETHRVSRNGKEVKLSSTEFRLLKFLAENTHRVVSKSLILEKVWGFDFSPESNIVEVYINYLRDKIDKGNAEPLIHTVHGVGYRLCVSD